MFEDLLYRYRSGDSASIEAFEKDRLYFSTPEYFNDPFDSIAYIDYNRLWYNINDDLDHHAKETLERKKKELFPLITASNQEHILKLFNDPKTRSEFQRAVDINIKHISKKIVENSKIICFSEEYLSNLMWSHYANYHKGFLLAYSKASLKSAGLYNHKHILLEQKTKLKKVSYNKYMPDFSEYMYCILPNNTRETIHKNRPMLIKMLSSKTEEWSYEKEWRLCSLSDSIESEDPAAYINISPVCVFVGARMDPLERRKLYNIAKKKSIPVFEVWCNSTEPDYKLNFCTLNVKELKEQIHK